MSQLPQNNEDFDDNPDYNRLNEQSIRYGQYGYDLRDLEYGQYLQDDLYNQPIKVVPAEAVQKIFERNLGEKAAQTSKVLGIIGLICVITFNWLPSLILGLIGFSKAKEAERYGVDASSGLSMNRMSVFLSVVILFVSCVFLLLGFLGTVSGGGYSP
ncbi:DUF4190 domain-containing protein [Rothia mucilaginosa]|uniref:DUF4190 domain-containing protein n=1 Tax=Rothia mucilaginosa TaxID=43675 RepID=UPI0028DC39EF|nr:DUF4190 domain-containing protein [Rothia mucilaginosa]